MMKAHTVDYNHDTGAVALKGGPLAETVTFTESATQLDIVAGGDVSVRVDPHWTTVEALGDDPLLVRDAKQDGVVRILTARRPTATEPAARSTSTSASESESESR